jgi:hypothetical protein
MRNLVPSDLSDRTLLSYLVQLQEAYNEKYGDTLHEMSDIPKLQIGQAVEEFIDLVMFTSSLPNKQYILKRLLSLKSAEKVLEELENYLPIEFNRDFDPDTERPKTFYTPRLLKVTIKSLTVNNLSTDFLNIISSMFDSLLYFIQEELSIEELIYRFELSLEDINLKLKVIPVKRINLDFDYYTS